MDNTIFGVGDVVELIPERDHLGVMASRFVGQLTVEEAKLISYQDVTHRNAWHPQGLVLRSSSGHLVMGFSDPGCPAIASGWYFRRVTS